MVDHLLNYTPDGK